jgi:hypothetical protein
MKTTNKVLLAGSTAIGLALSAAPAMAQVTIGGGTVDCGAGVDCPAGPINDSSGTLNVGTASYSTTNVGGYAGTTNINPAGGWWLDPAQVNIGNGSYTNVAVGTGSYTTTTIGGSAGTNTTNLASSTTNVTGTLSDNTGNLTVGDNLDVTGDLDVAGATTTAGITNTGGLTTDTLTATGLSSLGNVNVTGFLQTGDANAIDISDSEGLDFSGGGSITGVNNVTATGTVSGGSLSTTGTLTANGDTNVGTNSGTTNNLGTGSYSTTNVGGYAGTTNIGTSGGWWLDPNQVNVGTGSYTNVAIGTGSYTTTTIGSNAANNTTNLNSTTTNVGGTLNVSGATNTNGIVNVGDITTDTITVLGGFNVGAGANSVNTIGSGTGSSNTIGANDGTSTNLIQGQTRIQNGTSYVEVNPTNVTIHGGTTSTTVVVSNAGVQISDTTNGNTLLIDNTGAISNNGSQYGGTVRVNDTLSVRDGATVGGTLTVGGLTTVNGLASNANVVVGDGIAATAAGAATTAEVTRTGGAPYGIAQAALGTGVTIDANTQRISGVGNGTVSATSSEAVTGAQLFATNAQTSANTAAIGVLNTGLTNLTTTVNQNFLTLSDRANKAYQGVAMGFASSAAPLNLANGEGGISAGVGYFQGEWGGAVKAQYVTDAGVGVGINVGFSEDAVGGGVGASIKF